MIKITPKKFVELGTTLLSGGNVKDIPSMMLWGQPGVGKTVSIHSLAESVEATLRSTGKKVVVRVTGIDLTLYNPVDLRGIPTTNAEKTASVWLKPAILDLKSKVWLDETTNKVVEPQVGSFQTGSPINVPQGFKSIKEVTIGNMTKVYIVPETAERYEVINFLFMDELSAAPTSLQVCAYQLTHERRIGEHVLPENTYPICAGNRTTDKSVAYNMPKALANRVIHLEFESENLYEDGWKEWAIDAGIDERVIAFLGFKQSALNDFKPNTSELAFPTPRSWENVSRILKCIPDVNTAYPLIAGTVGEGVAIEFKSYCEIYTQLPSFADIADGKFVKQFDEPDILYAITTSILIGIRNASQEQITNCILYAYNMRTEFSAMTFREFARQGQLLTKFIHTEEWKALLSKTGSLLRD